ncbi:MAG TPA: ATP synthase F1 subunit gamma [Alphaproteobacteria bacterium]|nr:ATP synthase F1 subunit gamma [Alphaproteobacteria bacterium]
MATLKTLRTRIKSVKNTQQITKTMKMVAAAKVRRARAAVDGSRPYAARLSQILSDLTANAGGDAPLLLTGRPNVKIVRLIACGTDRGLCGSLNANLIKLSTQWVRGQLALGRTVQLVAVGRKMRDAFRQSFPHLLVASHTDFGRNIEVSAAQKIALEAREAFESGAADEVHLVFSQCVSMLTQTPAAKQLLPFAVGAVKTAEVDLNTPKPVASYEPSADAVLEKLLPLNLTQQVFAALLETNASEQAARMTAMDSATRNAGQMIKKLSIQYNRSRQAAITKELIEIISGAEAL